MYKIRRKSERKTYLSRYGRTFRRKNKNLGKEKPEKRLIIFAEIKTGESKIEELSEIKESARKSRFLVYPELVERIEFSLKSG